MEYGEVLKELIKKCGEWKTSLVYITLVRKSSCFGLASAYEFKQISFKDESATIIMDDDSFDFKHEKKMPYSLKGDFLLSYVALVLKLFKNLSPKIRHNSMNCKNL